MNNQYPIHVNKVVNVCSKVVGERQEQISHLYERRVVRKARAIIDDNSHVNFAYLNQIQCVQSVAFLNR